MTTLTYPRPMVEGSSLAGQRLDRALAAFRATGRMDVAFGGPVRPDGSALEISALCGARTQALANLVVHQGAGLGGKSLDVCRPVAVASYMSAPGITHVYDSAVRQEHLETVAAIPVVVEKMPRLVVYVASRAQVGLGDRWFDGFGPLVRRLERDIVVEREVQRRLRTIDRATLGPREVAPPPRRSDLQEIALELEEVAAAVQDEALRDRLEQVRRRCVRLAQPGPGVPATGLAPREIDVLRAIERGLSNRDAADSLGLAESTVKAYLKTAMRKLGASNRVQAIAAARDVGAL